MWKKTSLWCKFPHLGINKRSLSSSSLFPSWIFSGMVVGHTDTMETLSFWWLTANTSMWHSCQQLQHSYFLSFWQNDKIDDREDDEEEVLDEETKKKDQIVKGAIDGLIREYATELNAPSQDEDCQRRKRKKEKKEEVFSPLFAIFYLLGYFSIMSSVRHFLKWCFLCIQDDINTIDMEEDKRDLISREISKFRDTHKVKTSPSFF